VPLEAKPYSAHRGLTAAAVQLNFRDKTTAEILKKRRAGSPWQDDAWLYYDAIGEIKYAFRLFTNVLSRIRLYAAVVEDDDETPSPIQDSEMDELVKLAATRAMRRVFSGAGQTNILRTGGLNLLVAGECVLIQLPPKYGVRDKEEWRIISSDALITQSDKYLYKSEENQRVSEMEELPLTTFAARIWNEHARYANQADSSMKALVELCDELFLFSRAARATARSRLNAGALLVPDTLAVSADQATEVVADPDDPDAPALFDVESEDDEFEQELMDSMTTPIADEGSAASVVPLIIRGPAESLKEVRLVKFERTYDPQLAQRAERALERILQGIDLPKDIVTGLANIKYSNAVQIEESLYTAHVEPLVLMLCDAFRTVYLEPALREAGVSDEDIERIVIWYDPSAIMTAPDKSSAANTGHDKYALSDEAWRRANGFAETDAPEPEEIARRLAITRGQLSEEITEAVLRTFMSEILDAARAQSIAQSPSPLPPGVQDVLGGPPRPPEDVPATGPQPPPIVQDPNAQPQPPAPVSSP
jgi:hypothetical protein